MKRNMAWILAVALLLMSVPLFQDTAYADTPRTQQDAINWAMSKVGGILDYDKKHGAQCVDLINYYYQFFGLPVIYGHAYHFANNRLPDSRWVRYVYYNGMVPQPGDIAVSKNLDYGHVAIVIDATANQMGIVDQNGGYGGNKEGYTPEPIKYRRGVSPAYFQYYIRPYFVGSSSNQYYGENRYFTNEFAGRIKNSESGKVLYNNNGRIEVRTPTGDIREYFHVTSNGFPTRIVSCHDGRSLDVANASAQSGAPIQTVPYNGNPAQVWRFYLKNGHYAIKADCTSGVLDVEGGSNVEKARVISNNFTDSASQRWDAQIEVPCVNLGKDFYASIQNGNSGLALTNTGSNMIVKSPSGNDNQLFHFTYDKGYYTIVSQLDGKSLDVSNASSASGTNVQPWDYNETKAQRWRIYKKDGAYVLLSDCSPCLMDTQNGGSGANVLMNHASGSISQTWMIISSEPELSSPVLEEASVSGNSVRFSWSDVDGESGYGLLIWPSGNNDAAVGYLLSANTTSEERQCEPGSYQASVYAYNGSKKAYSNIISFVVNGNQKEDKFNIETLLFESTKITAKTTTDLNKDWSIRFNKNVLISAEEHIYLLDSTGKSIGCDVSLKSGDVLSVKPKNTFTPGQVYYLYIQKDAVISKNYGKLANDVLFMFVVSH